MTTRTVRNLLFAGVLAIGAAACSSGADDLTPVIPDPPPPPPPVVFTDFVKGQFDATADNTDPVAVDDEEFAFDDLDNPAAYDDLLNQ